MENETEEKTPADSARMQKVFQKSITELKKVTATMRAERELSLRDRRFCTIEGAQWEDGFGKQFSNKPRLESNKQILSVMRIISEMRNNRISARFVSKDGSDNEKLAENCTSAMRADMQDSNAEAATDNSFEEKVQGGIGAYRLIAEYEDPASEENDFQRIRWKPVYEADSCVFFSLDAKNQDKSDARRCWILVGMTPDAYEEEWGEIPKSTIGRDVSYSLLDWFSPNLIWVAEYYEVEEVKEWCNWFDGINGEKRKISGKKLSENDSEMADLVAQGFSLTKQKRVEKKRVHKYFMDGQRILEDCGYIPGPNIPVVIEYGRRWFIDGIERCAGHVRTSIDSARLGNMLRSKLAEIAALSTVEKPIFFAQQINAHRTMWANDSVENYTHLVIDPMIDPVTSQLLPTGPVGYTKPPEIPPSLAALVQVSDQDMRELLGGPVGGDQVVANVSAKAEQIVTDRLDMQTYIYVSNKAKADKRAAEIWLGMAREIYVEKGRLIKGIDSQGKARQIELDAPSIDPKTGATVNNNTFNGPALDVVVEIGPSSTSSKKATVQGLTEMMRVVSDPELLTAFSAMAALNMEGEGLSDLNEYLRRKLLSMGAVKPTEQEAVEMKKAKESQLPDPQAQYLAAAAQEAQAKAQKAQADTVLALANSEKSRATTAETLAGIDTAAQDQVIKILQTIQAMQSQVDPASIIPRQ